MAKDKVKWDGKKRFYKLDALHGALHDVHRDFTSKVWNMFTEREQAKWTTLTEADMAPIPKEVIEFEKKAEVAEAPAPDVLPATEYVEPEADPEEEEKEDLKKQLSDLGVRYSHNSKLSTLKKKLKDATDPE